MYVHLAIYSFNGLSISLQDQYMKLLYCFASQMPNFTKISKTHFCKLISNIVPSKASSLSSCIQHIGLSE